MTEGRLYVLDRRIRTASREVLPIRVLATDEEHRIISPVAFQNWGIRNAAEVWGNFDPEHYPNGVRNSSVIEATPGYIAPARLAVNAREGYLPDGCELRQEASYGIGDRVYAFNVIDSGTTCSFHLYGERELFSTHARVVGVQRVDLDSKLLGVRVGMGNIWRRK